MNIKLFFGVFKYIPLGKLLNAFALVSLIFASFGAQHVQARGEIYQVAPNEEASKRQGNQDNYEPQIFHHPEERVIERESTSLDVGTTVDNKEPYPSPSTDSFNVLECSGNISGTTCEVIEPGKHIRITWSGIGFNTFYGLTFGVHVLPSQVNMPVSWRVSSSHSESTIYFSQNAIHDYLNFYAITGSGYFNQLIAETEPGLYVEDTAVVSWEGIANTQPPYNNFVWRFGKAADWPTYDVWDIQIDFYYQ